MSKKINLVVAGVGLIGKRHIEAIFQSESSQLFAIVDPSTIAKEIAHKYQAKYFQSLNELFKHEKPDGVIIATPNQLHLENALECLENHCPILVEKPITSELKQAKTLVDKANELQVPVLVGHHRMHNPMIQKAKEIIDEKLLGQIRTVHTQCWFYKPDNYFEEAPWRTHKGAGPIMVNLIHDVNMMLAFCGNVEKVQAFKHPSIRGYENEDVAVAILHFQNGVLATLNISDMVVAPWSWELTARENPAYPHTHESSMLLGGTHGSLAIPNLTLWQHQVPSEPNQDNRSWWSPINSTQFTHEFSDPLTNQVEHFAKVIMKTEAPLVSAESGYQTLAVIEAVLKSAETNSLIHLSNLIEL